ncbi:MAG: hypothetical protein PHN49_09920 [Candidatus Omnitrophica bacterium]|nr:hypothetical protein [Candidatus Omnitrophota bacterium]
MVFFFIRLRGFDSVHAHALVCSESWQAGTGIHAEDGFLRSRAAKVAAKQNRLRAEAENREG